MRIGEALDTFDAVRPRDETLAASSAASMPFEAAMPALKGLPMVPNCDLRPEARVAQSPSAWRIRSASSPSSRPAAAVAPKAPAVAV